MRSAVASREGGACLHFDGGAPQRHREHGQVQRHRAGGRYGEHGQVQWHHAGGRHHRSASRWRQARGRYSRCASHWRQAGGQCLRCASRWRQAGGRCLRFRGRWRHAGGRCPRCASRWRQAGGRCVLCASRRRQAGGHRLRCASRRHVVLPRRCCRVHRHDALCLLWLRQCHEHRQGAQLCLGAPGFFDLWLGNHRVGVHCRALQRRADQLCRDPRFGDLRPHWRPAGFLELPRADGRLSARCHDVEGHVPPRAGQDLKPGHQQCIT
mmetsp:Transcript_56409/g.150978  ORF Transcript_56409/g.150978 Transcript_56409/m.150978 type:complete len:267 (+) Transcript_56409:188-988(+)